MHWNGFNKHFECFEEGEIISTTPSIISCSSKEPRLYIHLKAERVSIHININGSLSHPQRSGNFTPVGTNMVHTTSLLITRWPQTIFTWNIMSAYTNLQLHKLAEDGIMSCDAGCLKTYSSLLHNTELCHTSWLIISIMFHSVAFLEPTT